MWNTVPAEGHEEHEVSFSFYQQCWEQKLCQAKAGFHWRIVKVIIRSVNKDLVKTQCCDSAHDSVIYDQVKTRLSGSQAEAVELNQSHCDWFILPTLTIWFLLDCKWRRAKSEDSNSVTHMTLLMTESDFWFSQVKVISTLTTPLMILPTPSLVKTSLKTLNQPFANQFEEITWNWDTNSNSKANSLLNVVFK